MPGGSGSVMPMPVSATAPELLTRTVTVDLPPDDTVPGLKLLVAVIDEVKLILALAETGSKPRVSPLPSVSVPAALTVLL